MPLAAKALDRRYNTPIQTQNIDPIGLVPPMITDAHLLSIVQNNASRQQQQRPEPFRPIVNRHILPMNSAPSRSAVPTNELSAPSPVRSLTVLEQTVNFLQSQNAVRVQAENMANWRTQQGNPPAAAIVTQTMNANDQQIRLNDQRIAAGDVRIAQLERQVASLMAQAQREAPNMNGRAHSDPGLASQQSQSPRSVIEGDFAEPRHYEGLGLLRGKSGV